ncbi:hypothetical protein CH373_09355 [Leptospira perolatii]|uniref:Uncharacterized protein n=1 Tax=Leptospira perolatii TaxID=2023191 RepID=A0A2M9ZMW1_9LEPT|nr:DUF167 domain-containing protein [Leptospira perolatii]PJZ68516.1 hypothetical protein CH360_15855 [Leptospira perolatii]PJZ73385.1 hypothetical protein CH373_09355 [Leptospira perolatii]
MKLEVKVKPNSKKPSVEKIEEGKWVIAVREPAMDGRANEAVILAVAEELGVPKSRVQILRGQKGKIKLLEILE